MIGLVPEDLKKVNSTLFFKKEKHHQHPGNYRCISPLIPGKVIEQILLENVLKNSKDMMIGSSQHAFTRGKPCLTDLIAFCDKMTDWARGGQAIVVGYFLFVCLFAL